MMIWPPGLSSALRFHFSANRLFCTQLQLNFFLDFPPFRVDLLSPKVTDGHSLTGHSQSVSLVTDGHSLTGHSQSVSLVTDGHSLTGHSQSVSLVTDGQSHWSQPVSLTGHSQSVS